MTRFVHAGVLKFQWPNVINEMFRILKPATGWAQCCEMIEWNCDPKDSAIAQVASINQN